MINHFSSLVEVSNNFMILLALLSIFYWSTYWGKNRDERGYQIIGKSAIMTFMIFTLFVGTSTIMNMNEQIPDAALSEYFLFGYSISMIIFSLFIFIYNRLS